MAVTCSICGEPKDNPDRPFYPLWFTQVGTGAGVCPQCAAQLVEHSPGLSARAGLQEKTLAKAPDVCESKREQKSTGEP